MTMLSEREILVSILKLTKDGETKIEDISQDARIPLETIRKVLAKHSKTQAFKMDNEKVTINGQERLRIAIKAAELGVDFERVCRFLTWTEFEDIAVLAFEANGFAVQKHFRFKGSGRRWEVDILGLREPIVASVDCKHWHQGWRGASSAKAAEQQAQRTEALTQALPTLLGRIDIGRWRRAFFVPLILSLVPSMHKFHRGVPIVPVLQLRDFLQEMPAHINEMTRFRSQPVNVRSQDFHT